MGNGVGSCGGYNCCVVDVKTTSDYKKLQNQDRLQYVLNTFNYLPTRLAIEELTPNFGAEKMRTIFMDKKYNVYGGVFWTYRDLEQTLEEVNLNTNEFIDAVAALCVYPSAVMNLISPRPTHGNRTMPLVNGLPCLDAILRLIASATRFIDLSVMVFADDDVGLDLARALILRAHQGVEVRVIIDNQTTRYEMKMVNPGRGRKLKKMLEKGGVHVLSSEDESYWDVSWKLRKRHSLKKKGVPEVFLQVQDMVQHELATNMGTVYHRKFMVVDGERGWIGSANMASYYLAQAPFLPQENTQGAKGSWHDGLAVIEGAEWAAFMHTVFSEQWLVMGGEMFDWNSRKFLPWGENPVCGAPNGPPAFGNDDVCAFLCFPGNKTNVILQWFLGMLDSTTSEFIIENPYIVDSQFWSTVAEVPKERAPLIKIITPITVTDHPTAKRSIGCNCYELHQNGVQVFDYSTVSFSHWKIAVHPATNTVMHGSYNLNLRSKVWDFESTALIRSHESSQRVKQMLDYDISISRPIDDSDVHKGPHVGPACLMQNAIETYM